MKQRLVVAARLVVAVVVLAMAGCSTSPSARLSWRHVGDCARTAATSPPVWAPALGALALQVDDWDREVADWAVDHNPVFGSENGAQDASDALRSTAQFSFVVAALVTPTGEDGRYDLEEKVWDVGIGVGAALASRTATDAIKDWTGRTRPDASSDRSFPSGHSSHAAVTSTLTLRYVDYAPVPDWASSVARGTLITLPYATGWARVEARRHFPADVLAGIALGNFFGEFANQFLEFEEETSVTLIPSARGASLGFSTRF